MKYKFLQQTLAFTLLICVPSVVIAQTHIKSLIPAIKKSLNPTKHWSDKYSHIDNTVVYSFDASGLSINDLPAPVLDSLKAAIQADMETANSSSICPIKVDGETIELNYIRNDSLDMSAVVGTDKELWVNFQQNMPATQTGRTLWTLVNNYVNANYGKYCLSRNYPTTIYMPDNSGYENDIPCLNTCYRVPNEEAKEADADLSELIENHVQTTDYGNIIFDLENGKTFIKLESSNNEDCDRYIIHYNNDGSLMIEALQYDQTRPLIRKKYETHES